MIPQAPGPVLVGELARRGIGVPPTIVLSACSTGRRTLEDSVEPSSLAAGFLSEGAGEVIASLWNVNSEGTAHFMTEFYRALRDGATTSLALRAAMKSLARSSTFSHPYYWAPFSRFIRVSSKG